MLKEWHKAVKMTTNLLHSLSTSAEGEVLPSDSSTDLLQKLQKIAATANASLNQGLVEPDTISGLGICVVQMQGDTTCLYLDNHDKSVSPGIRMVTSLLATCLENEQNPRAAVLLNKAFKLAEEALKVRSGEIISSKLH